MNHKLSLSTTKKLLDTLNYGIYCGMHGLLPDGIDDPEIPGMTEVMNEYNVLTAKFNAAEEINNRALAEVVMMDLLGMMPQHSPQRDIIKARLKTISNLNHRYLK
jgi:hypothetical protein